MKNGNKPFNIETPGKQYQYCTSKKFQSVLREEGIAVSVQGRDEKLAVLSLGGEGGQYLNTTSASTPG